jgi:hypothetical protein
MSEKGDKCNYWAQEIGTQNGVIKFGALSPQGDVTCSVQIVGLDGRHFINMDEDGKRKGWTTMNAPGAFQINAGEDLIQINEGGGEGRKNKVEQNGIFINAENGDVTIRARNGKLRLEGLDIEMVASGNSPEGVCWVRANETLKLDGKNITIDGKQSYKLISTGLLTIGGLLGTQIISPLVTGITAASMTKIMPKPGKFK